MAAYSSRFLRARHTLEFTETSRWRTTTLGKRQLPCSGHRFSSLETFQLLCLNQPTVHPSTRKMTDPERPSSHLASFFPCLDLQKQLVQLQHPAARRNLPERLAAGRRGKRKKGSPHLTTLVRCGAVATYEGDHVRLGPPKSPSRSFAAENVGRWSIRRAADGEQQPAILAALLAYRTSSFYVPTTVYFIDTCQ